MLRLLLGRSGSGKTTWVIDRLAALARQGKENLLLLVPEQYSFESERRLLARLGAADAARVRVLSFTRLADTVFREVGGAAGEWPDDGVRALLMSRALEQVAAIAADSGDPTAPAARRRAADARYVEQMLHLEEEMRQCAVPTRELERVAGELTQETSASGRALSDKTAQLYRVLTVYEGLLSAGDFRQQDALAQLADRLPDSTLPDGATVFLDGFKGFTAQELAILDRFLPRVSEMTVALATDTAGKSQPHVSAQDCRREYTLFSPVTKTVEQLTRAASRHGLAWETVMLTENHRAADPALAALERELYAPGPAVYEEDASCVTVIPCADIYEECAAVARRVRALMRQESYRCREITLVARDLTAYAGILDDALEQEGIPCTIDARQELLCEPLMVYTRTALRLAVGGLNTEGILQLLKTDLGCLSPLETAQLENYLYQWRLDGDAWLSPFTENPEGLGARMSAEAARRLAELNMWREQITAPLVRLRASLSGTVTGKEFALALYRYLTDDGEMSARVVRRLADLEELEETVLAEHEARLWDEVIAILDRFASALGEERLPASRLEDLFTMLAQMVDMGNIPQGLDAVVIGSADRIRYTSPRAVFILGANEGVFPAYPEVTGVLSADDRHLLEHHGIKLVGDGPEQCMEERYFVYTAVTAPTELLTVTFIADGEAMPSPLIGMIHMILPHHRREKPERDDATDLETAQDVFTQLAGRFTRTDTVTETLRQLTAAQPAYEARLRAVARGAAQEPFRMEQPSVAAALFGRDMRLSASQTEQFYRCRFAYFCRYGLHVYPRKTADVDAAAFGTVVHYVMETLLPTYTVFGGLIDTLRAADEENAAASDEAKAAAERKTQESLMTRLQTDVHRAVERYLREEMGGGEHKSGAFLYRLQLAERSACNMLWHTVMELRQSAFHPVDYELSILPDPEEGRDGILSLRLPVDGGSVRLTGKVDRVDLYVRFDGKAYVRVIDYKTGHKTFDLSELTAGLNTQMLLYLFIICDNSRRYLEAAGELHPAGVLYHPLSDLIVERGKADADRARLKSMQMNGLVLDDPAIIRAMERDGERLYIPATLGKNGEPKGSVITERQFTLLRGVVERLLTQMASSLLAGDIDALPLLSGEHSPCEYCDYRAVCGRDEDAPARVLEKRSPEQVLTQLEEVTADAGESMDGQAETEH